MNYLKEPDPNASDFFKKRPEILVSEKKRFSLSQVNFTAEKKAEKERNCTV